MRRNACKKAISLLLVLILAVSAVSIAAPAPYAYAEGEEYSEAVGKLLERVASLPDEEAVKAMSSEEKAVLAEELYDINDEIFELHVVGAIDEEKAAELVFLLQNTYAPLLAEKETEEEKQPELSDIETRVAALPSVDDAQALCLEDKTALAAEVNDILAELDALQNMGKITQEKYDELTDLPEALRKCLAEDANTVIKVKTTEGFKAAFDKINAAGSGEFTVSVQQNISDIGRIVVSKPVSVTILGNGNTIDFTKGSGGHQGGFIISGGAQLNLGAEDGSDSLTISGNVKNEVGGLILIFDNETDEKAAAGGTLNMYDGVLITGVRADSTLGGAVTLSGFNTVFNMHGGAIVDCGAKGEANCYGGAVGVEKGCFTMQSGIIEACFAEGGDNSKGNGGGIAVVSGTVEIAAEEGKLAVIKTCKADCGGAVYAETGYVHLDNCTVENNTADIGGGCALFTAADIEKCSFNGNSAENYYGGAVYTTGAKLSIADTAFNNNSAGEMGGAIFADNAEVEILSTTVSGNTARLVGGGVCLYAVTSSEIKDTSITGNSASQGGGISIENCIAVNAAVGNSIHSNSASNCAADVYAQNSEAVFADDPYIGDGQQGEISALAENGDVVRGWFEDYPADAEIGDKRFADQTLIEHVQISSFDTTGDTFICMIAAQNDTKASIKFVDYDDSELSSAEYEVGTTADKIAIPTIPQRASAQYDYVFEKWMPEIHDVDGNATYKAEYKSIIREYKVRFNLKGHGDAITEQTVEYGKTASAPTAPSADGWMFGGWFEDEGYLTKYDFSKPVTGDITLYAKWSMAYSVTFIDADDTVLLAATMYADGTPASEIKQPEAPKKPMTATTAYTFKGWTPTVTDVVGNAIYKAEYKEEPREYTVTFDMNGVGTAPGEQKLHYEDKIAPVEAPTDAVCKFAGWYADKALVKVYDFDTPVTSDITLYAKWMSSYSVEHYLENDKHEFTRIGTDPDNTAAAIGTTVNASPKLYAGYHVDSSVAGTVSSGVVNKDGALILKLYYRVDEIKVGYDLAGGTGGDEYKTVGKSAGDTVTLPKAPTRTNFGFNGWMLGSKLYKPGETYVVTKDTVFVASWTAITLIPSPSPTVTPKPIVTPTPRPIYPGSNIYYPVKTGDTSNFVLWGAMLAISVCGIAGAVIYAKKKKTK